MNGQQERYIVKKHSKIEDYDAIIALKREHWPYSIESHREWIAMHLSDSDECVRLFTKWVKREELVAYLDLLQVPYRDGDTCFNALGIGNVCVRKENMGQGFGRKIVTIAMDIITARKVTGLLFCSKQYQFFYEKLGWKLTDKYLCDQATDQSIMVFNDMPSVRNAHFNRLF